MNTLAQEVFRKHALLGTPKADGIMSDGRGAYCAQGLLAFELGDVESQRCGWISHFGVDIGETVPRQCPVDGCHWIPRFIGNESEIIAHLSNSVRYQGHDWSWDMFANKYPFTEVEHG